MQESFRMENDLRRWKKYFQSNAPRSKRGQIVVRKRNGGSGITIFGRKHRNSNLQYKY